jgi:hypothetical protein
MINWASVAANSLWILGCSVTLAAFSFASWAASENKQKLRRALRSPGVWLALHIGLVLICAGLAATSQHGYEILIWIVLAIGFLAHWKWG